MEGQRQVAVLAVGDEAAGRAMHVRRKAPAIEQQDHLTTPGEGVAHGVFKRRADRRVGAVRTGFVTHVDDSHRRHRPGLDPARQVEPGVLAKLARHAENPEITELVAEARRGVIEVFTTVGAAHYQIGRTYPWLDSLDAPGRALIRAVKAELDPKGRMNPGVLDL